MFLSAAVKLFSRSRLVNLQHPARRFPWETNARRISDRALFRKAARAVGGVQS